MEKTDRRWMDADEAVAHIMRVTGKTRRQAKAALVEKFLKGEITTSGFNPDTGKREIIPAEAWDLAAEALRKWN